MSSAILNITARFLGPVLVLLSLIVLYRGHNLPGGGFIGGLIAASGILLIVLAKDWHGLERSWWPNPLLLLASGLAVTVLSGVIGLLYGQDFMTGIWLPAMELPLLGKVKLGTPLLFDVGVYLVVLGFTLKCAQALGEEFWK
ncbi:MAG: MnhB domain-containing protein [Puniceicoccaceae bacterium]